MSDVPIYGEPPQLLGCELQQLVCQSFIQHGQLITEANAIYIKASDRWFKLVLDAGTVHWRELPKQPEQLEVPEMGWTYPQVDVGNSQALVGRKITSLETFCLNSVLRVQIGLAGNRTFTVLEKDDSNWYVVE